VQKKIVTSCLIFLISFATCNETMAYFCKMFSDSSYCWVNNVSCEEKGEESEESVKKSETSDFFHDLFHSHKLIAAFMPDRGFNPNTNHIFSSSDFSEEVYFPPEMI
jgi:hypothetical protein